MRPKLTKDLKVEEFKDYYWLKEELHFFCKEHQIYAYGSKEELNRRIETFLLTGETKTKGSERKKIKNKKRIKKELTFETVIDENHRCGQDVREFFKSVIPKFHFSTHIQKFFKENVGKKYEDVVKEWYEEEERKKDPTYKREIGKQFEYNQFMRDFFKEEKNKGKSRKDAIEEWNRIKKESKNKK